MDGNVDEAYAGDTVNVKEAGLESGAIRTV
jgi:hypothetical protein